MVYITSWIVDLKSVTWDNKLLNGLEFMNKTVLQVPFVLMTLMGYVTPTLDEMLVYHPPTTSSQTNSTSFMESLQWVDTTYIQKHNSDNPDTLRAMYYPNLVMYPTKGHSRAISEAVLAFSHRYAKRMGMLLGLYILSLVPILGRYVMPVASFYTFRTQVGTVPAAVIFGAGLVLPKAFIVRFLHTYFASRGLMRELVSTLQFACRMIS